MKCISLILLCVLCVMSVPAVYAQSTEGEVSSPGTFILNRGIFGIVYKTIIGVGKAVEAVVFGRFGVAGVKDYLKTDKVFLKQNPKY